MIRASQINFLTSNRKRGLNFVSYNFFSLFLVNDFVVRIICNFIIYILSPEHHVISKPFLFVSLFPAACVTGNEISKYGLCELDSLAVAIAMTIVASDWLILRENGRW